MWPRATSERRNLANYLINSQHNDTVKLLETMTKNWSLSKNNGFICVKNGPMFSDKLATIEKDETIPCTELVLLGLHVVWISFYPQVATAACFVQSKTLEPNPSPFWVSLFGHLAWILYPPECIRDAMMIGRPDLLEIVQKGYLEWLGRAKSPKYIQKAIGTLLETPWQFCTHTKLWGYMESLIISACVQVGTTKSFPIPRDLAIVTTGREKAAIVLNGHIPLVVHSRDMIFIIIVLLFGKHTNWAVDGVPADAPVQFSELAEEMPYMFSENVPAPYVLFDDLPILSNGV